MRPELSEYAALPSHSDHLGDCHTNYRKSEIIRNLDEKGNDPEVTLFLLDVLRDQMEYDLARVEAIQVAAIYVREDNPHYQAVQKEILRIHGDTREDEMIRGWAERYVSWSD
jgi:hypothetical protein